MFLFTVKIRNCGINKLKKHLMHRRKINKENTIIYLFVGNAVNVSDGERTNKIDQLLYIVHVLLVYKSTYYRLLFLECYKLLYHLSYRIIAAWIHSNVAFETKGLQDKHCLVSVSLLPHVNHK